MKFKLKELINMQPSLGKVMLKELPVITAFKLGRFVKSVTSELEEYERQRLVLLRRFAVLREDGVTLETTEDGRAVFRDKKDEDNFNKELDQLAELEVEINFEQLSMCDLGGVIIAVSVLLGVSKLFSDFNDD